MRKLIFLSFFSFFFFSKTIIIYSTNRYETWCLDRFQSKLGTPPQIFVLTPFSTQVLITITLSHTLEYKASDIIIMSSIGYVILHHPFYAYMGDNATFLWLLHHIGATCVSRRSIHTHVGGASGHEIIVLPRLLYIAI